MKNLGLLAAAAVLWTTVSLGMESQTVSLSVWKKGETVLGEEFVAMNEEIVDYLATLKRPTEGLKPFKYSCSAKIRSIRPSTQLFTSGNQDWVIVRALYALKDCKALD